MSKVLLTTVIRSWGRTADRVHQCAQNLVFGCNTPPPFETECPEPNMVVLSQAITSEIKVIETAVRKGMMNNSTFRVETDYEKGRISVIHCRNTKEDRIFLIIQKV